MAHQPGKSGRHIYSRVSVCSCVVVVPEPVSHPWIRRYRVEGLTRSAAAARGILPSDCAIADSIALRITSSKGRIVSDGGVLNGLTGSGGTSAGRANGAARSRRVTSAGNIAAVT
jgi:hypothetical protein